MRLLFSIMILLIGVDAFAGYFVEKGLFVETFIVVGRGKTRIDAMEDAKRAIPQATKYVRYEPNTNWTSPSLQCMEGGVWNEKDECMGNDIQYVIPLKRGEQ